MSRTMPKMQGSTDRGGRCLLDGARGVHQATLTSDLGAGVETVERRVALPIDRLGFGSSERKQIWVGPSPVQLRQKLKLCEGSDCVE